MSQPSAEPAAATIGDACRVYLDARMPRIILLGLISGFPWVLIGSMITLWLKEEGFSRSGIGLFGIVFTVYAFNMLWAPIVDAVRLPVLHRLGQRRSWIILMQSLIAVWMLLMAGMNPQQHVYLISVLAFLIAMCSATQDVAVDALRIELIGESEPNKVGAASAMATSGWWVGYGLFGALALTLAEVLEEAGIEGYWQATYLAMIGVIALSSTLLLLFVREEQGRMRSRVQEQDVQQMRQMLATGKRGHLLAPLASNRVHKTLVILSLLAALFSFQFAGSLVPPAVSAYGGYASFFYLWVSFALGFAAVLAVLLAAGGLLAGSGRDGVAAGALARAYAIWYMPALNFVRRHGVRIGLIIIALVFLFKVGEAFLGRMSLVFYKEVGFSKSDIALYSKGYGTIALVAFTIVGSLINARYGLFRGLLIGGIAMAATNLLFAVLALYPEKWLFAVAVVSDQFTTAMSTVALVAFLSQLCDRAYTATQYAALASLGNFSRTTLAAGSGVVVDSLGGNWTVFFILTTVMVLPSLALLLYVRRDIQPVMQGKTVGIL